jgi:hypothetical protein
MVKVGLVYLKRGRKEKTINDLPKKGQVLIVRIKLNYKG